MREKPLFFKREGHRLFGILHKPINCNGIGFVFCHPFAEEKLWAHRIYVNYARQLAMNGFTVLRFDYMGHGDSSGYFEDSTVLTRLEDIKQSIIEIENTTERIKKVGLIGLRFGATLAALVAETVNEIGPLILWEPVVNGAQHMKEMIRINLTTQTTVYKEIRYNTKELVSKLKEGANINIDGYEIANDMYDQMNNIVLTANESRHTGPVLAIQINKREGLGTKRIDGLSKRYENLTSLSVVEQPFWKEIKEYYTNAHNLFEATTSWIDKNA